MMDATETSPETRLTNKKNPSESTPAAADSKRKSKRQEWYRENLNKRLGPLEGNVEHGGARQKQGDGDRNWKKGPKKSLTGQTDDPSNQESDESKRPKKTAKNLSVFVGHIAFDAKEEDVKTLFEGIGKIKTFRWLTHPKTKKFKGMAFVTFENKGSYKRAFTLHHHILNGKPINVEATVAGAKKSKFRKDIIKEKTKKLQQEAAEKVSKSKKASDSISQSNETAKSTDTTSNVAESSGAKAEKPTKTRPNKPMSKKPVDVTVPNALDKQDDSVASGNPVDESKNRGVNGSARKGQTTAESSFQGEKKGSQSNDMDEKKRKISENNQAPDSKKSADKAVEKKPRLAATFPEKKSTDAKNEGVKGSTNLPTAPLIFNPPKPKQPHLAALGNKRIHVKFDD